MAILMLFKKCFICYKLMNVLYSNKILLIIIRRLKHIYLFLLVVSLYLQFFVSPK